MATTVRARVRDGCVVDSRPLSGIVGSFVDDWSRGRPTNRGQYEAGGTRATSSQHVSALEWLEQQTGVPQWKLEKIQFARDPAVELRDADAIISAIGCPQVFHDGTLVIRQNPAASASARAACCSGSLTGDGAAR